MTAAKAHKPLTHLLWEWNPNKVELQKPTDKTQKLNPNPNRKLEPEPEPLRTQT